MQCWMFTADGARLGLDAAQIEELLAAPEADPDTGEPPARLFVTRGDREVPVIGTVESGRVRLSLATMWGEDEKLLAESIRAALGE